MEPGSPEPRGDARAEVRAQPVKRTLVFVRHAKSRWDTEDVDHDRPLAPRGIREGKAAGEWLARHDIRPELVLCSTAVRTRETLDRLVAGGLVTDQVSFTSRIYLGDDLDLIALLRETGDGVGSVLLIGHNNALEDAVRRLAQGTGDPEFWEQMDRKFPTSAIAVLEQEGPWAALASGTTTLIDYAVPRG